MTTTVSGAVRVMKTPNKGELVLCFGDLNEEGCTYQTISNDKMVSMILGATGDFLPGQQVEISLQVKAD